MPGRRRIAVSTTAGVSIIVVLIAVVGLGMYVAISTNSGNTTTISSKQRDSIRLENFSLNPTDSNLSGTVMMNSGSSLSRMDLYINGSFMGSVNYSSGTTFSSPYSMMYSFSPRTMPMMSKMTMVAGRDYNVTMVAHFNDGSSCKASSEVVAEQGGMMSSTSMMGSSNMMSAETTKTAMMTTNMIGSSTSNMMTSQETMMSTTSMMNSESTEMMSSSVMMSSTSMMVSHVTTTTQMMSMNSASHMMG